MNIEFISITVQNFRSYGNTPETFYFKNGLDLVKGTNGKGKTSIFLHSIIYALYGEGVSGESVTSLPNRINKKQMLVTLDMISNNIPYRIERGRSPNVFNIFVGSIENNIVTYFSESKKSISIKEDTKYIIENILFGIDKKTFISLFAIQANSQDISIFRMKTSQRREMLENIFDLTIYKKMKNQELEEINLLEMKLTPLQIRYDEKERHHKLLVIKQADYKTNANEKIQSLESQKNEISKKLLPNIIDKELELVTIEKQYKLGVQIYSKFESLYTVTTKQIIDLNNDVKELEKLEKEFNTSNLKEIKSKMDTISSQIKDIDFIIHKNDAEIKINTENFKKYGKCIEECECLKKLLQTGDLNEEEWKKLRKDASSNRMKLDKEYQTLDKEYQNTLNSFYKKESLLKSLKRLEQSIETNIEEFKKSFKTDFTKDNIQEKWKLISEKIYNKNIKLEKEVTELNKIINEQKNLSNLKNRIHTEISSYKSMMKKIISEDEIETLKKDLKLIEKDVNILLKDIKKKKEVHDFLKKDKIKYFIMKKSFPILRRYFNEILDQFFFGEVKVTISDDFDIKILRNGTAQSFQDFSEGEKKRLDLGFIFTIHRFLSDKNQLKVNLLMMDELLDGSLDSDGVQTVLQYLEHLKHEMDIIIITHRDENIDYDRKFTIVKHKRFSKIKNSN